MRVATGKSGLEACRASYSMLGLFQDMRGFRGDQVVALGKVQIEMTALLREFDAIAADAASRRQSSMRSEPASA